MTAEDNMALVRRYYEEIWNDGNTAVIDEILSPAFRFYPPDAPEGLQGDATYKEYVAWHRNTFPDHNIIVTDVLAGDDKVAVRWTARGTHRGDYAGVPASGNHIVVRGMDLFTMDSFQNKLNT